MKTLKRLHQALIKPKLGCWKETYKSTSKTKSISLIPDRNKALKNTTGAFRSSAFGSNEITSRSLPYQRIRKVKLLNYIKRIKKNETNQTDDIPPYIPHFEEGDHTEHDHHKRSFLLRSLEAVTNCNSPQVI